MRQHDTPMIEDKIKAIDECMEAYRERIGESNLSAFQKVALLRIRTWEAEFLKDQIRKHESRETLIPQGFAATGSILNLAPTTSGFTKGQQLQTIIGYSNTGRIEHRILSREDNKDSKHDDSGSWRGLYW